MADALPANTLRRAVVAVLASVAVVYDLATKMTTEQVTEAQRAADASVETCLIGSYEVWRQMAFTASWPAAPGEQRVFGGSWWYPAVRWWWRMRAMMEGYRCPPGSVVIFTESLVHAANDWTNPDNPRCAVFNCYNSAWAQWHRVGLDHETIMRMPPKRRSLFRGVWQIGGNPTYSAENRTL